MKYHHGLGDLDKNPLHTFVANYLTTPTPHDMASGILHRFNYMSAVVMLLNEYTHPLHEYSSKSWPEDGSPHHPDQPVTVIESNHHWGISVFMERNFKGDSDNYAPLFVPLCPNHVHPDHPPITNTHMTTKRPEAPLLGIISNDISNPLTIKRVCSGCGLKSPMYSSFTVKHPYLTRVTNEVLKQNFEWWKVWLAFTLGFRLMRDSHHNNQALLHHTRDGRLSVMPGKLNYTAYFYQTLVAALTMRRYRPEDGHDRPTTKKTQEAIWRVCANDLNPSDELYSRHDVLNNHKDFTALYTKRFALKFEEAHKLAWLVVKSYPYPGPQLFGGDGQMLNQYSDEKAFDPQHKPTLADNPWLDTERYNQFKEAMKIQIALGLPFRDAYKPTFDRIYSI